jgi:hypothetical protein
MARGRSFEIGGLNIRVHTRHHPDEYVEFWHMLHKNRGTALYGSSAMMIGEARNENKDDPRSPIVGYLYKFLNIDPDEPWFDILRRKPATEDDVSKVSIPDYLKPNLQVIPYVFLPAKHRLYFVSKSSDGGMAASTVHSLLSKLILRKHIAERFGDVDVTVLTDRKAINELLSWRVIKTLEIFIERPNALEDEDETDVLNRLDLLSARSERIILKKASEASTLTPDDRVKTLAHIAADHGEVKVSGKNPKGIQDSASSKDFPMHVRSSYDPDIQTSLGALISFVMRKFL